ncbi:MAG: DUF1559 domain-containing protein, partial [Planctomycetaceae bacterium]|nr:DUF1559 domain-containing protein [Planctomycetaceae bacterium]
QKSPALIAVPGKVNLSEELKAKLEIAGIYGVPGLLGGFTIFVVDDLSANNQQAPNIGEPIPNVGEPMPLNSPTAPAAPTPVSPTLPANNPNANTPITTTDTPENEIADSAENAAATAAEDNLKKYVEIVEIFKKLKTKDRSEIKSALHIQRYSPIRIVFAPSSSIKTLIGMTSLIPNNQVSTNKSTKDLISNGVKILNKLQSISIGFIPEQIRLNFAIEFLSEQDAQDAYKLMEKSFDALKASAGEKPENPNAEITWYVSIAPTEADEKILEHFKPRLRKHRILYSLTEKVLDGTSSIMAESAAQGAMTAKTFAEDFWVENHIKTIIMALNFYQQQNAQKKFPPIYTENAEGKPLHSWRVLILPYLGENELYKKIKLDEPWDSEHNKQFHNTAINAYQERLQGKKGMCRFVAIIGSPMQPKVETTFDDITDGTANTVAVVELREPFCWMDPTADITVEEFSKPLDSKDVSIGNPNGNGVALGYWDGSTKRIPITTPPEILKAIATPKGGENVKLP